jgi:DNA adenine methylase
VGARPFLKWAGGKQWLAARLVGLMPHQQCTYYEPFLGGGSLFFAARPRKAVLGDINQRLVETYQAVRDCVDDVIPILSRWGNDEETYYKVRATQFQDALWRAAQFIYLNKTCWNGLYRVNRQGEFNVPFGYNGRKVFDEAGLHEASELLQNAAIACCDFPQLLTTATAGDFVYLDPPYTVMHSPNGFRHYNERLFCWQDQIRLARTAGEVARRGCLVVVSNADSEEIRALYPEFSYQGVSRHSVLAADAKRRRPIGEAVFSSSGPLWL